MSGIYNGYNPIFESLKKELYEQETKNNPGLISRTIYDTLVNVILMGSDESIKTPDGFKVFVDKLLQVSSIDGLRQEFIKKIDEYAMKDKAQEAAYQQTKTYLGTLFDQLKPLVGEDAKNFKKVLDDMNAYAGTTISALQANKAQLQQNESLLTKYLSEQQTDLTGEEGQTQDVRVDNKFLQYAKNALDAATSFAGETSAAMGNKAYAGNADIQRFSDQAQQLLDKARKIQPIGGNKGLFGAGKVPTASGNLKRSDFKVQVQNILTEITRQREEFNKLKYRIGNVPTPPQPIVICPVGQAYDPNKGKCVALAQSSTGVEGAETTVDPNKKKKKKKKTGDDNVVTTTDCAFPIQISSTKCDVVVEVQEALMKLGPCVAELINKAGGADGKYGKVTSKLANIYYAYLTKSSAFSATGELTQDMHNKIVGGQRVIQTIDAPVKPVKDSLDYSKVLESKIFEAEYNEGTSVVSFDSFSKILNEGVFDAVKDAEKSLVDKAKNVGSKPQVSGEGSSDKNKLSIADAVCSTYKDDKIIQDVIVDNDDNKKVEEKKWQGLKPADNGIYVINYDESSGEAALQVAEVTGAVTAIVIASALTLGAAVPAVAAGTATGVGGAIGAVTTGSGALMGAAATSAAASTGGLALSLGLGSTVAAAASGGAALAVGSVPIAVGAGALSGMGTAWWGTRTKVAISVGNGFISRAGMLKITRGMINTIDGFVSREDLQAIMATLCLLKGAWTANKERTAAISAWADFKERYAKSEEQTFESEIEEIHSTLKRDCHNFPDFDAKSLEEGDTVNYSDGLTLVKEAIDRLNSNESKLAENIKDITEEQLDLANQGVKIVKKGESEEEGKKSTSKAPEASNMPKP
jgi:hypothetical protein